MPEKLDFEVFICDCRVPRFDLNDGSCFSYSKRRRVPGMVDPTLPRIGKKFKVVFASLLYWLIVESQKLGGTVLDQFCHRRFKENTEQKSVDHKVLQKLT